MSARFLLIRHAATALAGTFCGWSDPELNDLGYRQAAALVGRLAGERIDGLYCSDLQRAIETAAVLGDARAMTAQVRPRLREVGFGEWEAMTWGHVVCRNPIYAARWMADFPRLSAPGGELYEDFRRRVLEEMGWLSAELEHVATGAGDGDDVQLAAVTHAGVIGLVLEEFGGFSTHAAWQRARDYTCVIHCELDESSARLRIIKEP